jgi:hypothetical protein
LALAFAALFIADFTSAVRKTYRRWGLQRTG